MRYKNSFKETSTYIPEETIRGNFSKNKKTEKQTNCLQKCKMQNFCSLPNNLAYPVDFIIISIKTKK